MTKRCLLCQTPAPEARTLRHDATDATVTLCPACLRTKTRAKAPRNDARARGRIREQAARSRHEVWLGEHVVYLTPPLPAAREDAPLAPPAQAPTEA